MQVDWFTVAAQIVNFLILVWLLKRFLYQPVMDAMARREARIAERLRKAGDEARAAREEKERYVAQQEALRHAVDQEMHKAKAEAESFRAKLVDKAKQEVEQNREQWLNALEKEKNSFLAETSRVLARSFEQLARKGMRTLADAGLEERMVEVFLARLESLPDNEKQAIAKLLVEKRETALITSAFALSPELRGKMSDRFNALWGPTATRFEINEALLAGISLEVADKKIRWDMEYYLEEFQRSLALSLDRQSVL